MTSIKDLRDLLKQKSVQIPKDRVLKKDDTAIDSTRKKRNDIVGSGVKGGNRQIEYQAIKGNLHERLIDEMNDAGVLVQPDDELKSFVLRFVESVLENEELPLNETERARLSDDLIEETLGSGPLATLMADPAVTDILVNRFDEIFVERFGILESTDIEFRDEEHLVRIINRMAARVGRRIDTSSPMVDARLPDGSRINATLPPITIDGPTLSIRRFGRKRLSQNDLIRLEMFSESMLEFISICVQARRNMLISGGTGSGKSTLLGAVSQSIPNRERIITIEDAAELLLNQRHVIRMETRTSNIEGQGQITQRELVVNALRMRPDRIILGEVRAGEALDMLQAMNTGHDGSLTTIHANSPRDAFARLETMVMMSGLELPSRAIREQMVSAINFIIHVRRYDDGVRRVERISEVVGMENQTPQMQDIFEFKQSGRSGNRIVGQHVATGIVPRIVDELISRGIAINKQGLFGRESR